MPLINESPSTLLRATLLLGDQVEELNKTTKRR